MSQDRGTLLGVDGVALPLRVIGAKRGVGSFLMIDLVDADADRESGERWTLWVYLCDWALLRDGVECLNSDCNDNSAYDRWLKKLSGSDLLAAAAMDGNESCRFVFANGFELILNDASDQYGHQQDLVKVFKGEVFLFSFKSGVGASH